MLKVLLKKQISEVFKSYFFDAKKNKMRSKWAIAGWFIFFVLVMVGMLGGMFTALALTLCGSFEAVGMSWLYFLMMGGIAILLGAFGSVFNTYAGLYLAKDNDQLLSLPIPVKTIVTARLANVYLMGAMYSLTALIPALAVYWIVAGPTAARVICGLLFLLIVTVIVLLLSCLLGWVVARISLKLKNKSFITVLAALVFIAAYYFFYFKANDFIKDILLHAETYGERIRGAAYGLYLFGRVGEGDWLATAIVGAVTALAFVLIWTVLHRSFLKIATSSGSVGKVRYTEKRAKEKSVFGAILAKEFGRFTGSANYMLNCGLGVLLIPAGGVLILLKGQLIAEAIDEVLSARPGSAAILMGTMLFVLASLNTASAPSVSLEGKSIWIPQSLPVEPKMVLRAKAAVQLLLTAVPELFAVICFAVALDFPLPEKLLLCLMPLVFVSFWALFCTLVGVRMPLLNWTDETAPIKQSASVAVAIFGAWGISLVFAGAYLLIGYKLGAALYLLLWTLLFALGAVLSLRWLDTKGAETFAAL